HFLLHFLKRNRKRWRITPHLVDRLQLNELKVAFFLLGKSRKIKIKIKIMNEYIGFRHSIFRGFLSAGRECNFADTPTLD
ncbi:MAG: hypothetical protein Q8O72_08000, partial [Bacteroidales bacterium]|nr:hypothetical protein [Bacteroidales bacterium]